MCRQQRDESKNAPCSCAAASQLLGLLAGGTLAQVPQVARVSQVARVCSPCALRLALCLLSLCARCLCLRKGRACREQPLARSPFATSAWAPCALCALLAACSLPARCLLAALVSHAQLLGQHFASPADDYAKRLEACVCIMLVLPALRVACRRGCLTDRGGRGRERRSKT